jgi:hypothetical protein
MAPQSNANLAQRGLVTAEGGCDYGDVKAAARAIGVSASYLNKLRVYGGGPEYLKFGRTVRYHIPSVLVWASAQTRRSTSDHAA